MQFRDRVQELRRVRAGDLVPNPRNWRQHPPGQRTVLRALLREIGFAGAILARQMANGTLELLDGHLRAETTPDEMVPVLVVDLNDEEAAKLLATYDPLGAMAQTNQAVLGELVNSIQVQDDALKQMLHQLAGEPGHLEGEPVAPAATIPKLFQVVVECADEETQQSLFERLSAEGFACRLLML